MTVLSLAVVDTIGPADEHEYDLSLWGQDDEYEHTARLTKKAAEDTLLALATALGASVTLPTVTMTVPGTVTRVTGAVADWSSYEGSVAPRSASAGADVVTSLIREEFWPRTRKDGTIDPEHLATALHAPVIDLDVPVTYVPSTTEGHGHLYFDTPMTGDQMWALVAVMVSVGLVEPGYLRASIDRGFLSVRLPWVKKVDPETTITAIAEGLDF
jgi:hypothetical protein